MKQRLERLLLIYWREQKHAVGKDDQAMQTLFTMAVEYLEEQIWKSDIDWTLANIVNKMLSIHP